MKQTKIGLCERCGKPTKDYQILCNLCNPLWVKTYFANVTGDSTQAQRDELWNNFINSIKRSFIFR
jgi:hypothetical protein